MVLLHHPLSSQNGVGDGGDAVNELSHTAGQARETDLPQIGVLIVQRDMTVGCIDGDWNMTRL